MLFAQIYGVTVNNHKKSCCELQFKINNIILMLLLSNYIFCWNYFKGEQLEKREAEKKQGTRTPLQPTETLTDKNKETERISQDKDPALTKSKVPKGLSAIVN